MKKKILFVAVILCLILALFPACDISTEGSIKSITRPYIDEYECVEARIGDEDILSQYEFIKITLLDKNELELNYQTKDGEKHSVKGKYELDDATQEMTSEIGFMGFEFMEKIKIENGEFSFTKNIFGKTFYMKFKSI